MLKILWAEFSIMNTWNATTMSIVCKLPFAYSSIDSTGDSAHSFISIATFPPKDVDIQ